MLPDEGDLFGRGVGFPPRVGADGRVSFSAGPENVRQSIRVILLTEPGERIMLREFGGGLKRFLFQPNVSSTHREIEDTIKLALGRFEPRLDVRSVDVTPAGDDAGAAVATIRYALTVNHAEEQVQLRLQLAAGG